MIILTNKDNGANFLTLLDSIHGVAFDGHESNRSNWGGGEILREESKPCPLSHL